MIKLKILIVGSRRRAHFRCRADQATSRSQLVNTRGVDRSQAFYYRQSRRRHEGTDRLSSLRRYVVAGQRGASTRVMAHGPGRATVRRIGIVAAGIVMLVGVAASPAFAGGDSGGPINCGAQYAYTYSFSAGTTWHKQGVGGSFPQHFFIPAPTAGDPYRAWSQGIHSFSAPGWAMEATVFDHGGADCVQPG